MTSFTYTKEQEQAIRDASPINNAIALELAERFGPDCTPASVRMKAVRMDGVQYVKLAKATKSGEPIESKEDIANEIGELMGCPMDSLVNATKPHLQKLRDRLAA